MKIFNDDKILNPPEDFSDLDTHVWRARMLGAISCYIDSKTWEDVYDRITVTTRKIAIAKEDHARD